MVWLKRSEFDQFLELLKKAKTKIGTNNATTKPTKSTFRKNRKTKR